MRRIRTIQNYTAYVPKSRADIWACVLQLGLLFLAVLSTVLCVSTSLAMTISIFEIALWCLLFTVLFAAAVYNKITFGIFAGVFALGCLIFWQSIVKLANTLVAALRFCYDLGLVIMKMAGWNYTSHMLTDEATVSKILEDAALSTTYFRTVVVVLAFVFAFWFVALAWKRPRVWVTVIPAIAILAPGFYIGLAPAPAAFCLLLSCAFGLYIQTLAGRKVHRKSLKAWLTGLFTKQERKARFFYTAKSGIYGLSITGISLCFMLLVALVTYHTPLVELDQVRRYLDDGSEFVYNRLFYSRLEVPDGSIGNLLSEDEVKILNIPDIHDVPVMTVTSRHNETFYLRAWATDEFKNDAWQVLDEEDEREMKAATAEGADPYLFMYTLHQAFVPERLDMDQQKSYGFVTDELTVHARFHKSLVVHLPTYGASGEIGGEYDGITGTTEVKLFENDRPTGNHYTVSSFQPIITTKGFVTALYALSQKYMTIVEGTDTSDVPSETFQNFVLRERSYAAYAKAHYTDAFGISYDMEELAAELGGGHSSQLTRVLAIERYFRDNSVFTYNPAPALLPDANAIEQIRYSLFENAEGYCSYFATAMTLMVRSLGYPARFVSGYIVRDKEDAEEATSYRRTVMDSDSHAWVEVYFDGLGWLSFDPTPDETETADEFNARYYALELEAAGNGGDAAEQPANDPFHANYIEEQDPDPEQMPEIPDDRWLLETLQTILWIALAAAVVIILPSVLLVYTKRKVRRLHKSVYVEGDSPADTVNRMNRLMNRWLALRKLTIDAGETAEDYARRVDLVLSLEHKLKDVLPILSLCAYSEHEITEEERARVADCYEELYAKLHKGRKQLPIWRQFRE